MSRVFTWVAPAGYALTKEGYRCSRCGSGFPSCCDLNPVTGEDFEHKDVCDGTIFPPFADHMPVCDTCEEEMKSEY